MKKAQQKKCLLNSGYDNEASAAYSKHYNNTFAFSSVTHLWQWTHFSSKTDFAYQNNTSHLMDSDFICCE